MKRKIILLISILAWVIFILYNSLQPGSNSNAMSTPIVTFFYDILQKIKINIDYLTLSTIIRKGAHVFEYLILSLLVTKLFYDSSLSTKYFLIYSFLISLLVSITDETIQTFVRGRSGSITDVGIDSIGIIAGILIVIWIHKIIRKRKLR